ncbi:MAG TPA: hypothetical protein ENJ95_07875 [Bacteroidetes bacterium]|nr:hypothetical protein [Bacteroidota bacterium]
METYKLNKVLEEEEAMLRERRKRLFGEEESLKLEDNKFGIALSGGGIRSATINLGFLKTLNLFKILEKADYISTVSGGGYTGAYVQATVKQLDGFDKLFHEEKIDRLRKYGDYMIPGQGKLAKLWNLILLTFGYLVSWAMSLLSPVAAVLMVYLLFRVVASIPFLDIKHSLLDWTEDGNVVMGIMRPALWTLGGLMAAHFIANLLFNFSLGISKFFTKIESVLALLILVFVALASIITIDTSGEWAGNQILWALLAAFGLYVFGFLLNPNSLSFHRYYRKQLADAFLSHTGNYRNLELKKLFTLEEKGNRNYLAPYPLINTCLNLQNPGGTDKFKGAKASDYFLLSPAFCGSKLSNYVKTADFPGYRYMTLPAALTISAAAVNPGMGIYSNKLLSIMMTLFNARLGFWVNNPGAKKRGFLPNWATHLAWWPAFFFKELLSKIGTDNCKLNISDGGHIENLAVYELLRRRCRLILAVDAGADPDSTFADLENLSLRARNELGVDISFRSGQDPVDIIRPKASSGYARKRFAVADLMKIWEEFYLKDEKGKTVVFKKRVVKKGVIKEWEQSLEVLVNYFYNKKDKSVLKFRVDLKAERGIDFTKERFDELKQRAIDVVKTKLDRMTDKQGSDKIKMGTLVYIKSSVTSPRKLFVPQYLADGSPNPQFDTFKYKIYHPDFPHESTADQFFDPVQWESYFQLGQFIASDVLDTPKVPDEYRRGEYDVNIDELIEHFDNKTPIFQHTGEQTELIDISEIEPLVDELLVDVVEEAPRSFVPEPAAPTKQKEAVPYDPELQQPEEEIYDEMKFKI